MARKTSWSTARIDKLVKDFILNGNDNAYYELQKIEKTITHRANERLRSLEKIGRTTTAAYKYAKEYNNPWNQPGKTNRFHLAKDRGIYGVASNIEITKKFLRYKTSTVSGTKKIDMRILNAFRDKGIVIPKGQEQDFLELLESDEFEKLKKYYQDSKVAVNDLEAASMLDGFDINHYRALIKRVTDNEITYDVAMSELGVII